MHNTSKNELSPICTFLMRVLWLLYTSAANFLELVDATLWPAWKAVVLCLDQQIKFGYIISIVDAVTGTLSLPTITPFGSLARLATSLFIKFIDWFPEVPSIPEQRCGSNYKSFSTQTTDDTTTSAMLEFFGSGLDHLAEFFATGLKSVVSPFDGNTLKSSTPSLVAVPRTPMRQQCSLVSKTKSTSPTIYGSDDDAA
ncbi:hypothetical protein B0H65DRAFT_1061 [Neurospora tetraspora]|uniref:Uncharacterized protein n=1 Tax=Neurospora tetraspora TaxID=94610 RepID=A0AAE0JM45_9PEZI|nr:hypothetical protein B0H65DRAFT_1061 [Neurospora tetraspora]